MRMLCECSIAYLFCNRFQQDARIIALFVSAVNIANCKKMPGHLCGPERE